MRLLTWPAAPGQLLLKSVQLWLHGVCFQLDVQYDAFIRTTSPKHKQLVHEIVKRVWEKGDIYLASYEGWCVLP